MKYNREYLKVDWKQKTKNKKFGYLYVVECYNEEERFIKIGITTNKIARRFKDFPYKYEVLFVRKHLNMSNLFDKENLIIKMFTEYAYNPNIKFSGMSECFCINKKKDIIRLSKKGLKNISIISSK